LSTKVDMNHYEKNICIPIATHQSIYIQLQNKNSHILMTIVLISYPFCHNKQYIITDSDCNRLIAEYAATRLEIKIKLDLSCILSSDYYAYPFHPFIWHLLSIKTNKDMKVCTREKIENMLQFHNHCTNNRRKRHSLHHFFENDIATFFRNNNLFKLL